MPVQPHLGFPVSSDYRFRLRGRRCRVGPSGLRTLTLLLEIYESCATCEEVSWSVRIREQVRQVQALSAKSVLCHVIECTDNPTLRILAIWLRGRCGGSIGTTSLVKFVSHPDEVTRKEVARALKRMNAWTQLGKIADGDASARIRRIATVQPPRAYKDRVADFSKHIARLEVRPVRRPLILSPELQVGQGRPPKTPAYIRMLLNRIRCIVRGKPLQSANRQETRRSPR